MYVARTPRFSSAEATWLILAAKRVFVRCTGVYATPRARARPRTRVRAFVLYRDSALRRDALRAPIGDPSRYSLYGLDELERAGLAVRHDLEPEFEAGRRARAEARVLDRAVRLGGGYSGDFARVLASLAALNRSDVVFSTVDTVGIPLALLGRLGRVKPPVVYAAIGLPERLALLRGRFANRVFDDAFRRLDTIVAYGWGEVEELRAWLGPHGPRVEFVAFGVDTESFRPDADAVVERRRRLDRCGSAP